MSSFSCPHFDMENDYCQRLRTDCVPGGPVACCARTRSSPFPSSSVSARRPKPGSGSETSRKDGIRDSRSDGSRCPSIIPSPA